MAIRTSTYGTCSEQPMIKKILLSLLAILVALGIGGFAFYQTSDQFGADLTDEQLAIYKHSINFTGEEFLNQIETLEDTSFDNLMGMLDEYLNSPIITEPSKPVEVIKVDRDTLLANTSETQILWFGHSSFLMQINGMNLLFDPMLTGTPAPHPMLGGDRYSPELPISIADLPQADAVFISHDHYDHLDLESIQQLNSKVGHYFVPLGVGLHLKEWGIATSRITELDWWQTAKLGDTEFTFTPSRHFSGRRLEGRNRTLWGGWVVKDAQQTIYYSGDGGYGPHFKEIGQRFGEIDLALVECGQYNERWANIHLMPEQTIQAGMEANVKVIMPVHWGAFTIALHAWDDPIERAIAEAEKENQAIIAPQIGEIVRVNQPPAVNWWWRKYSANNN